MKTVHIPFENPSYTDPRRPCHDHNNHIIDWEANEIAEQESEIEFKRWFNESIHIRVNTILTKNIKKKWDRMSSSSLVKTDREDTDYLLYGPK